MKRCAAWVRALLWACLLTSPAIAADWTATEHQVKAVFVFNFSHFVTFPPSAFATPTSPFVIGVLGDGAMAAQLDEAVRGERVDTHPMQVQRFRSIDEIGPCQILYIEATDAAALSRILERLRNRPTLTVSADDGAAETGAAIQFVRENNRIRLRINVNATRAAGLVVSSKLLRPAEIVRTGLRSR